MTQKLAVCIGINDYPGTDSDLSGCVNDAQDWRAALLRYGFDCQLLLNADASGAGIRSALTALTQRAGKGDVVVITFSGHGSFVSDTDGDEADGLDECWCPHDVIANGPITDDEMHAIFSTREKDVRWIVISDSCHSGTVARFSRITTPATTPGPGAPQRLVRFLAPSVFSTITEMKLRTEKGLRVYRASPPGRRDSLVMSGCQDTEYSYDAWFEGRPNGAFTFVALRELERLDPDGSYEDWYTRIRASLPSQQYPQAPNLFGPKSMRRWVALAGSDEVAHHRIAPAAVPAAQANLRISDDVVKKARRTGRRLAVEALDQTPMRSVATRSGVKTRIIAEGDSWFDFPGSDVINSLEDNHGYDVTSVARRGHTLEHMAYSGGEIAQFGRALQKMQDHGEPPSAVLLSSGGNDVVGDEFVQLLNHRSSPNPGLNRSVLDGILYERIWPGYETLISAIIELCKTILGEQIPVLIHGYAYPVPDGRGVWGLGWLLPGPWLLPSFEAKGYRPDTDSATMQKIVDIVVNSLNTMQQEMVARRGDNLVRHVDIRPVIPRADDHTIWWQDELHPTSDGFDAVAREFDKAINSALGRATVPAPPDGLGN